MNLLRRRVLEFERRCVIRILRKARGSVSEAARLCGIERTQFYGIARRLELDVRAIRASLPEEPPGGKQKKWFGVPLGSHDGSSRT